MANPSCVLKVPGPSAGLPCACQVVVTAVCPHCGDAGAALAPYAGGVAVVCEACGQGQSYPGLALADVLQEVCRKAAQ
jgi:hypothetical protein